jgi:hypothetical protein
MTDTIEIGTVNDRMGKIVQALEAVSDFKLQLFCKVEYGSTNSGKGNRKNQNQKTELISVLCVIIYGPLKMSEDFGVWASKWSLYLQDPSNCDRNVPYRNPHLMSPVDEVPLMTFQLETPRISLQVDQVSNRLDPLALLRSEYILPETEPPSIVDTPLLRYEI